MFRSPSASISAISLATPFTKGSQPRKPRSGCVEGSIGFSNVDGAVGIQAQAGTSGSITNTGAISIGETFAPGINKDGFSYEPYAQGTGRYGIETVGAFTGGISAGTYTYSTSTGVVTAQTYSGSIDVTGNNSYGIFIGGGLAGGPGVGFLNISGTVTVSGDNSVGVWTQGEITGGVQINNTVSVHGEYTTGVQTTGPIDGSLTIYSTVTSTGYASATRPTTSVILNDVQGTPSQIEQSGSALVVQGSVGGGIFLGAPPANTVAGTASDLDGDGVPDGAEGTAAVETFGSAPAFVIGGASPITIGQFGSCIAAGYGPGDNCFGLIVEGVVAGDGIYDNVSGTGLQIGGYGGTVNISGGIRISNTGNISASAYQNNATAMILGSGAITPLIQNEGTITATLAANSGTHSASALIIQSGASRSHPAQLRDHQRPFDRGCGLRLRRGGPERHGLNGAQPGNDLGFLDPTVATDATTGAGRRAESERQYDRRHPYPVRRRAERRHAVHRRRCPAQPDRAQQCAAVGRYGDRGAQPGFRYGQSADYQQRGKLSGRPDLYRHGPHRQRAQRHAAGQFAHDHHRPIPVGSAPPASWCSRSIRNMRPAAVSTPSSTWERRRSPTALRWARPSCPRPPSPRSSR